MSMYACPNTDYEGWDYILGNVNLDLTILQDRYNYLSKLDFLSGYELQVAVRDVSSGAWTKWQSFPKPLMKYVRVDKWNNKIEMLAAYDVTPRGFEPHSQQYKCTYSKLTQLIFNGINLYTVLSCYRLTFIIRFRSHSSVG